MPYPANAAQRQKFPKARYRVKNWREYDQALQTRGSLTLWVALVHKSRQRPAVALAGFLYRMRSETGILSWVMRLITAQATCASVFCAANFRARRQEPIKVL